MTMPMPSTSSSLTSSRVSGSGGGSGVENQVWPPGFRFHPTDEELVLYYLKRKVCGKRLKLDIIAETDVYKWDPEDLPELSKLKTGDRLWFFFSPRDRKYPNGARSNRATHHGYWKATGKDRRITCNSRSVGLKKTLVFYKGRAPNGTRTDWVMHEYTLDEEELKRCQNVGDYYALYKVYKKSGPGPKNGEQYGAPFKEEEWADEECTEVVSNAVDISNLSEPPDLEAAGLRKIADKLVHSVDETERTCNSSGEISAIELQSAEYADSFHQSFGDETKSTTTFDPLEQGPVVQPISHQFYTCGGFDYSQSPAPQIVEVPDITSGLNIDELTSILDDGDFLEANDLLGPEPIPSSEENPLATLRFGDTYDGLGEWDLFDDASMFLHDNGTDDLNAMFTEGHTLSNNFEVQPQLVDASVLTSELWGHQAQYINEPAGTHAGSSVNGQSTSVAGQQDFQNQNGNMSRPQNRVTSALWAFVESIPTTPASASENIIFNQALERVSSFRKTRLSAMNSLTTEGTNEVVKDFKSRGILLFSIVGAVFAMLWVIMSRTTTVPVL